MKNKAYNMRLKDFDYFLPKELIAQKPVFPRDQCRLMALDRKTGRIEHQHFFDIADYLRRGDVLVLNDSKVFKARLYGKLKMQNAKCKIKVEIFLLRPLTLTLSHKGRGKIEKRFLSLGGRGKERGNIWEVLGNPGKKLKIGAKVYFSPPPHPSPIKGEGIKGRGNVWCEVVEKKDGKYLVRFNIAGKKFWQFISRYGHVPVPPYIKREPERPEEYQTVYAKQLGSVAAPTAGFHFTKSLLNKLRRKGVKIHYITLHVGYGTFKPIKTEKVEEHKMEPEWVEISKATAEAIARAKKEGRRVVAVGTTVVRALEGAHKEFPISNFQFPNKFQISKSKFQNLSGEVNLFITPGFKFKIIDALITNFHLPRSTLLLLVSAFASPSPNLSPKGRGRGEGRLKGRDLIKKAYQEAIKKRYNFYSFGDAMVIV